MNIFELIGQWMERVILKLYSVASYDTQPPDDPIIPASVPPIIAPSAPKRPVDKSSAKKPSLEQVAIAMRDFEGKPGDPNYRNNNPLNCKFYYGGYLPIYEPVKRSPAGFAIFKDYATGWLYGCNELRSKIKHHPNWTLLDMVTDHAPPADNNPSLIYAQTVAKTVGVDISYKVINLV